MPLGGRNVERGIVSARFHKDVLPNIHIDDETISGNNGVGQRVQWHSLRQHLKPPTKSSVTVEKRQLSDQRKHRGKAMPDFRWRTKSPLFVRRREEDGCSHPELSFRLRKYLCEGQTMPFEWTQESVC